MKIYIETLFISMIVALTDIVSGMYKKAYRNIVRTINWNIIRGNDSTTLNWDLEIAMLQEELDELKEAKTEVDQLDALLDLKFVINGTLTKMGLNYKDIVLSYEAVVEANEQKSSTKNAEGKITKPKDFVGPETKLQKILDAKNTR